MGFLTEGAACIDAKPLSTISCIKIVVGWLVWLLRSATPTNCPFHTLGKDAESHQHFVS